MNYYVSTNGNNANDGLSPETAWADISYACGEVASGSIGSWNNLIIGTGEYILTSTNNVTFNYVNIIGDINGKYFNKAGKVICKISSSSIRIFNISSGKHVDIYNIYGISTLEVNPRYESTYFIVGNTARVYNCIVENFAYGIYGADYVYQCLFYQCFHGARDCMETHNCVYIRNNDGCYNGVHYNGIFIYNLYAINPNSNAKGYNCYLIENYRKSGAVFNSIIGDEGYGTQYDTIRFHNYSQRVYHYNSNGVSTRLDFSMPRNYFNFSDITSIQKGFASIGNNLVPGGDYGLDKDVFGMPVSGYDGNYPIGLTRNNLIDQNITSITCNRASIKLFILPCVAGTKTVLTCEVSKKNTVSQPEILVYDENKTLIASDQAQSDQDNLIVEIISDIDQVYNVWLYANENTEGASTEFKNLKINGLTATIINMGEFLPILAPWEQVPSPVKYLKFNDENIETIRNLSLFDLVNGITLPVQSTDKEITYHKEIFSTVKTKEDIGIFDKNIIGQVSDFPSNPEAGQIIVKDNKSYIFKEL